MALRNQPYLPLYVNDFITDEKLRECEAASVGVYIYLLCLMHKSEEYGRILLYQKGKQNCSSMQSFANKLAKHLPFTSDIINDALLDLISNRVIQNDGNALSQKRMIRDNEISEKRAIAGKIGGDTANKNKPKKSNFANKFGIAKSEAKHTANYENEYININVNENININKNIDIIKEVIQYLNEKTGRNYKHTNTVAKTKITARLNQKYTVEDFKKVIDIKAAEWLGTEFEKFLRPDTLFGEKFDLYLNQKQKLKKHDPTMKSFEV